MRCPVCATPFLPRAEGGVPAGPAPGPAPPPPEPAGVAPPVPAGARAWVVGTRLGPVVLALLPLLIPLVRDGGARWLGLGAALAGLGLVLALPRRWPPSVRWLGLLGVNGVGFGLAASSVLVPPAAVAPTVRGAPEDLPPLSPVIPRVGMIPGVGAAAADTPVPLGRVVVLSLPVEFGELKPQRLALAPGAGNALRLAARVRRWLAFAADPRRGSAFASTPDGMLRHYSYPGFRLRRTYRLGRPAYRLVLDGRRGLLHAAVSDPDLFEVGPLGEVESAGGDVWTFDVKPLSAGKVAEGELLRPTAKVSLGAHVQNLLPSPDGRRLYYLVAVGRQTRVGRLDVPGGRKGRELVLRPGALLSLPPDGKVLYALTGGGLLVLEPDTLRHDRTLAVPGPSGGMAAADGGRVFLAFRGRQAEVYAVDLNRQKVEGFWVAALPGDLGLALHPDQKGFFLGNSAVAGRRILSVRLTAQPRRPGEEVGEARSDGSGLLRGTFQLTPDGRFLADSGGKVYRVRAGKGD